MNIKLKQSLPPVTQSHALLMLDRVSLRMLLRAAECYQGRLTMQREKHLHRGEFDWVRLVNEQLEIAAHLIETIRGKI